jgi:spermidine/putrescine transport system substrate-binding protein
MRLPALLLQLAACTAVALLALAGCDRDRNTADPGTSGGVLNVFCWSEYIPQEVFDGFSRETGIKVNVETYDSNEKMLSKLGGATRYDLLQPSEYAVEHLVKEGRLAPIDWARVPNIRNIAPEMLSLPHDPERKYCVPSMSGTVGIIVNTAKIKDPITGYKDVFQEKYKGRIIALDDSREIVSWAMAVHNIPVNNITRENLERIRPTIAQWVKLIKLYNSDDPKGNLRDGDVDLGITWSGEAALLIAEDPEKWKYVLPAEGAHRFVDSFCIPADAPNKDAAMKFIDYFLRPEVSKRVSDAFPYTNPNLEARKLLTPGQRQNPASYPKDAPKLDTFRHIDPELQGAIEKLWIELKAGQ